MASRATNIIRALYGDELGSSTKRGLLGRINARSGTPALLATKCPYRVRRQRRRRWTVLLVTLGTAGILGLGLFVMGVYFFNILTRLEQDVFKGQARIDSLLQRRRNISTNLARTVRDYAIHERGVFGHVSNMRATGQGVGNPEDPSATSGVEEQTPVPGRGVVPRPGPTRAPAPPSRLGEGEKGSMIEKIISLLNGSTAQDVGGRLRGLLAISEQYPDLKLSENFQRFMEALVETEKAISDERITYSETVNAYTTQLKSLPARWFAKLYGFAPLPYYQADDGAKMFRPVEY